MDDGPPIPAEKVRNPTAVHLFWATIAWAVVPVGVYVVARIMGVAPTDPQANHGPWYGTTIQDICILVWLLAVPLGLLTVGMFVYRFVKHQSWVATAGVVLLQVILFCAGSWCVVELFD